MQKLRCTAIYKITNSINGKIYIGSSKNFYSRYLAHKSKKNINTYLGRAFRKYGFENFIFEVLESPEIVDLIKREQFWMDFYKSYDKSIGYNSRPTAESNLGFKHSDSTKNKLSESQKGKPRKNGNSYRNYSDTQREKFKNTMKELKHDWKQVSQFDLKENLIKTFPSISEAGRQTGLNFKSISRCALGQRKTAFGFIWKFCISPI